jgi:hypothetical protein
VSSGLRDFRYIFQRKTGTVAWRTRTYLPADHVRSRNRELAQGHEHTSRLTMYVPETESWLKDTNIHPGWPCTFQKPRAGSRTQTYFPADHVRSRNRELAQAATLTCIPEGYCSKLVLDTDYIALLEVFPSPSNKFRKSIRHPNIQRNTVWATYSVVKQTINTAAWLGRQS